MAPSPQEMVSPVLRCPYLSHGASPYVQRVRVVGIDPGVDDLGIAAVEFTAHYARPDTKKAALEKHELTPVMETTLCACRCPDMGASTMFATELHEPLKPGRRTTHFIGASHLRVHVLKTASMLGVDEKMSDTNARILGTVQFILDHEPVFVGFKPHFVFIEKQLLNKFSSGKQAMINVEAALLAAVRVCMTLGGAPHAHASIVNSKIKTMFLEDCWVVEAVDPTGERRARAEATKNTKMIGSSKIRQNLLKDLGIEYTKACLKNNVSTRRIVDLIKKENNKRKGDVCDAFMYCIQCVARMPFVGVRECVQRMQTSDRETAAMPPPPDILPVRSTKRKTEQKKKRKLKSKADKPKRKKVSSASEAPRKAGEKKEYESEQDKAFLEVLDTFSVERVSDDDSDSTTDLELSESDTNGSPQYGLVS